MEPFLLYLYLMIIITTVHHHRHHRRLFYNCIEKRETHTTPPALINSLLFVCIDPIHNPNFPMTNADPVWPSLAAARAR